jgi:2-polyprenyl-3-methyl-5-hydroxy-6-metoxy-1,4-benzoquinol methylase
MNEEKLHAFMGKMVGYMTGGAVCQSIWLGDELGLYRALAGKRPTSADALADATHCNRRLVREWLDGQAAAGLLKYHAADDTYELEPEPAMALADDSSPVFVARAMHAFASMMIDVPKVVKAFRGDGALAWGDHHECLFSGTEWFFRTGYRAYLTSAWIPALEGVATKLEAGGRIADVGCGHGASSLVMAQAYPRSQVFGFDYHAPSVATSIKRAQDAGVRNAEFQHKTATSYPGQYDLICFFDCLHDMGDPVGAARYAREHLLPGGTVMLVEPFALDDRAKNMQNNPMAALFFAASTSICTPNSLSQERAMGLGAQAGEARLRGVFGEAGFGHFRRAAETPMNIIVEARVQ